MVVGLFTEPSDAELCLDNLAEADFDSRSISLVMQTREEVETIADVSGSLTGILLEDLPAKLVNLGLSPEDAAAYKDGVLNGGVFIAISAGAAEAVAAEMLRDNNARDVRLIDRV